MSCNYIFIYYRNSYDLHMVVPPVYKPISRELTKNSVLVELIGSDEWFEEGMNMHRSTILFKSSHHSIVVSRHEISELL